MKKEKVKKFETAELRRKLLQMEIENLIDGDLRGADRSRLNGLIALLAQGDKEIEQDSETRAFKNWLRTGDKAAELRTANVMEIGTNTQGGYFVPQSFADAYPTGLSRHLHRREGHSSPQ
jgi:HK97 family phage major capsid protein